MKSKEEVLRHIRVFIRNFKNDITYTRLSNKIKGLLIIGGSSLILINNGALPTRDIDAYVVKENNKIDWFYNFMIEPGLAEDINDQAAKDIPLLTKLIMLDTNYILIKNINGINIYIPSYETLILTKVIAICDRNKDKDKIDLNLLLSNAYDIIKLKDLKERWLNTYDKYWQRFEIREFNNIFDEYVNKKLE